MSKNPAGNSGSWGKNYVVGCEKVQEVKDSKTKVKSSHALAIRAGKLRLAVTGIKAVSEITKVDLVSIPEPYRLTRTKRQSTSSTY